jgi:hypothetical protein
MGRSARDLSCQSPGVFEGAHVQQPTMCLTEFAVARCIVAEKPGNLGRDLVDNGVSAVPARLSD